MFILRRISGDGVEINQVIGNAYTVISKFRNQKEFSECLKKQSDYVGGDEERIFAFLSFDVALSHGNPQPLYNNQQNYIMCASGVTFDHLRPFREDEIDSQQSTSGKH